MRQRRFVTSKTTIDRADLPIRLFRVEDEVVRPFLTTCEGETAIQISSLPQLRSKSEIMCSCQPKSITRNRSVSFLIRD